MRTAARQNQTMLRTARRPSDEQEEKRQPLEQPGLTPGAAEEPHAEEGEEVEAEAHERRRRATPLGNDRRQERVEEQRPVVVDQAGGPVRRDEHADPRGDREHDAPPRFVRTSVSPRSPTSPAASRTDPCTFAQTTRSGSASIPGVRACASPRRGARRGARRTDRRSTARAAPSRSTTPATPSNATSGTLRTLPPNRRAPTIARPNAAMRRSA